MADDSSHPLVVGNHEGSAHTHDGAIDHLMIFPEVLNAEAVNLLYSSATAFQFTYAEWDNWVGGEVVALTSDNGKVAVVTTGKELIVYNSAGVEQWREPTEDIPSSVEFANGRVSYTLAALREGFTHDDNFAGIEEDTDLSYYFKYGRPAGLYTMDECDGEILYDSSGHGLRSEDTFIVAGGQSGGSNNGKPAWVGGVDGCALHFHSEGNAKGNYVQWEERYRGPQIAGDSYTISYWWNQATDGTTIDSAYEAGDKPNQNSWGISGRHGTAYNPNVYTQSNFNNVNFFCYNSNEYIEKGPDYPEDYIKRSPEGWIMHTCVRDLTTGEVSLYINGELIHTQSDDSTPMFRQNVYTDPDHWTIGRNQAGYYGTGNVDEVVFYKQALSAADIFDMYKRTVSTPFDMNPVGYWPLDLWVQEGDGYAVTGNVEDKSGNANNGWTYSNPTSTQDYAQLNYPSFTSGAVGTSPPAGYTENNPAVCNWAIDNTHYKLSNKALGVDCINQQPSGASTSLDHTSPITVPSNTEYTLSGWVYVDLLGMDLDGAGGNGYVTYLSMYDNVGIGPTDFSGCNLGTTTVGEKVIENPSDWEQWHYLSCTGNTGGATTLNIGMRVQDFRCDAICVWFDDLQLKVGPRLTKGMVGNALIFDGIGDHIKLNNQVVESTAVTVSAWVRPDSAPTNVNRVVGSELANDGFILYFDASGHARFLVGDGTTTGDVVGTTVIQSGGWYHLVGTYDGTTTSIYVNGVLEGTDGTSPATITYPAGGNTYIGGDESGGVGPERLFKGAIDEVAIFDRALSSDEIKTLAYKSQSRLDAGLLAFYPAHEEQDHSSWDSYDNQLGLYPMTLVGGASFDDGKIGDGLTFDGVNDYANLGALGPSGATPRTLSFWIKLDECPGAVPATCPSAVNKFFMSFGEAVGGKFFAPRIVSATNALGIMIHNAGDYEDIQCSDVGYEELEDKWNHITYTYDGDTTITIYVNGMFDCSATTGIPLDTSSGFDAYIGARNDGGWSLGTVADIDEVGIWSRALSPGEIIELYNSRTHEAFHEDGFVTYSSTGERIVDTTGGNSQFTGIAVADDGTTVMLYDSDLESDTTAEEYWVYGNTLGTAASFDKNGDMINLGNVATFTGATELSIGTWLYRTGYNQHLTALVSKDGSFEAFISSGNFGSKPYLSLSICGGAGASVEFPTVSVPVDTWTHVGFTFEGNGGSGSDTRKVYIDGVLADTQTTGTKSVVCSTGDDLSIGARSNGIYTLPGQMSDLRLYTELLDAGEMAQLASQNPFITGNYATTSTTLTGWWKLNEDFTEGATAVDSSASGNDGTPVGAETYYNHMQSRYAVFDGTDDYIALGQPLIDDANEGLTFSIWFKEESFTQQTGIFSRRYAEDGLAVWNACDQWTFRLELDTVLNAIYTTGNCDGEWHNFIGTWDGTTMRTYVDGNYQDKTTPGCSPCAFTNTGHTFNIGRDLYSTTTLTASSLMSVSMIQQSPKQISQR
jgi:hypothetical protein